MAAPASLAELAGETVGQALAFAAGFAAGRALEPVGVGLAQTAWALDPLRAPDAGTMASGVAQGQVTRDEAKKWARQHGYGDDAFGALVDVANTGPALGYAYQAWRRGALSDAEFSTALRRTGLETQWYDAMRTLKHDRLDLGAIATAIHRGIMRGQGLIITEPPVGAGHVPFPPPSDLDPALEAESHGIDRERLRILVGNTGLPPGLMEMLRLLNMGRVTENDVKRAVAESNMRNEYMDVALHLRRQLLTPSQYAEGALRGWITPEQMHAGAALHGMESADADLLFHNVGRPINVHQIVTGLARGGKYGGDYEGVPEPFNKALRESNVRPEWGNLAYANRYTYPSAFVIRALAQSGDWTEQRTHSTLLAIGWPPDVAKETAAKWAGGTAAKADPYVVKAQTQLWTALHKSYVNEESDDAVATDNLTAIGVTAQAQPHVLELWKRERALTTKTLTPSQIKKAYVAAKMTQDEAVTRLEQQGYNAADAATFLAE